MFRSKRRSRQKGSSGSAPPERKFRPRVEALEARALPSFAAPVSYNVGTQPSQFNGSVGSDGVATGDFRGIGRTDLAVVHSADNTVNILLSNGDGTFQPAVSYPTGGTFALYVLVADFNGDGKQDLAVLNQGNQNVANFASTVSIFLGNGDGTFQHAVQYSIGRLGRGFTVGDFYGDGKLDLATANFFESTVSILRGNGDGTFQSHLSTIAVPAAPRWVTAGDFKGDGKADLAVADGVGTAGQSGSTAGLTVLLNNGTGTFTTAGQYASPPTPGDGTINPEFVTAADLRHNGITDLIVCDYDHNLNVFLGNGDGTFQPAVGYDTGEYPRAVAIADVNGDGVPDLVVDNIGGLNETPPAHGSVAVLLGNGDGTFRDAIQYTPVNYPGWLAVGDFNGDGLPDIAVSQVQDGHSVDVMLNQGDLLAAGRTLQATAGQPLLAVVAWFYDPGPNPGRATDYTVVIDWGDGTPRSTGGNADIGGGAFEVAAIHTYADPGEYAITVTVTDTRVPNRIATVVITAEVDGGGGPGGGGAAAPAGAAQAFLLIPAANAERPGGGDPVGSAPMALVAATPAAVLPLGMPKPDAGVVFAAPSASGQSSTYVGLLESLGWWGPAVFDELTANLRA